MASKAEEFLEMAEAHIVSAVGLRQASAYINHLLESAPNVDVEKKFGDAGRQVYLVNIVGSKLKISVEPR